MRKLICVLSIFAVAICFSKISFAAEHPGTKAKSKEHPDKAPAAEHPGEHPGEKAMLSAEEIIKGIKDNIDKVTKEHKGYYPVEDSEEGKHLNLKLVKVHEDRVSYIKKDEAYFACTDFITEDGKTTYDIDFWMKKNKKGELEVYKEKIHKKDGKARFTYKDDEIVEIEPAKKAPEEGTGEMSPEEHT